VLVWNMGVIMAPVLGSGSMPACNALVPNFISAKIKSKWN